MTASSLTERYVHEVVRWIPADQRDDIADELRATIADTVEARGATEREVLTEMGAPARLAARYADRPPALIGPDLFPVYKRLLVGLLSTVLPLVAAALMLLDIADGKSVGAAIGGAVTMVLTVGAQMIAWVTMLFALVERSLHRRGATARTRAWTPDDLPAPVQRERRGAATLTSAVWHALLLVLIIWQHVAKPYRLGDARAQVLDPALWSGWIWPILLGLAGIVALNLIQLTTRDWTVPLAAVHAAAHAIFALPVAYVLSRHMLFDPNVLTDFNGPDWKTPDAFYNVTALAVLAVSAGQAIKRFREARG
ncbi:HAAS signaling domain-containing protein [Actinoallomurus iriomotensis]|uniref:Uncharacterized protein n=1 Tax=Actinoallomurus iriomotensis TaxID=478107 RepID=A0A9W6RWW5_9ACTN|nr:hypothetical protein [Actinoallomurus iriomotensis]GLY81627.1 hypothetical protein Airi01_098940 [Actinoallomurus iriomotensis]